MSGSGINPGVERLEPSRRRRLWIAAVGLCCASFVPEGAHAALLNRLFDGPRRNVAMPSPAWDAPPRERRTSVRPRRKVPENATARGAAPKKAVPGTKKQKGETGSEAASGAIQSPQYYVYKAEKMAPVDFGPLRDLPQAAGGAP